MRREWKLNTVIFALGRRWKAQGETLRIRLEMEGITCAAYEDGMIAEKAGNKGILAVTDDKELALKMKAENVPCVGCAGMEEGYFDGAGMVTDHPGELEVRTLEEYLLRFYGLPVTIAKTDRVLIREIVRSDFEDLRRISMQAEMGYLQDICRPGGGGRDPGICVQAEIERLQDICHSGEGGRDPGTCEQAETAYFQGAMGESCFEPDRLEAYISHVYRLYGYGLWSVVKKSGGAPETLIGCCGLSDWEGACPSENGSQRENAGCGEADFSGSGVCLEMQYMVDEFYQGQGYGTEMCRAVLDYAFGYLEADEVWLRIHPDNEPSLGLAGKLGFGLVGMGPDGLLYFQTTR